MQCHLTARYIPGQYNGIADGLSRAKALPEWHLSKTVLEMIFQKLGQPDIDLFASRTSAVVPAYVSEDSTDQGSQFTDAFSRMWQFRLGWIFPPPALIPQVLHHLQSSEGQYLLVTPLWPRAFWEPEVRKRIIIRDHWLDANDLETLRGETLQLNNVRIFETLQLYN
ncbi:hypothetical protein ACJJTC_008940 [Scirpophaga incertulas]